ncbi:MAG: P1 family peptidase [Clostridiaceae bacterium]|nr:P1 family peptidase [Clostridiaceae bacterium]
MKEIDLLEVGGFRAGHAQDREAGTGCTVLLFDGCAPAGVDIRGGGPASRETPLLDPRMDAKGIHALLLSGGSAFGLDAAGGVMHYLEERDIGFDTGVTKVPLVCQSCIFDLAVGRPDVRPDAAMAYHACENASREPLANGCVGGGTGACVGKYRGREFAMKTGIGTWAVQVGEIRVGAVVVLNALGDIFDIDTGKQIAGMRTEDGRGLRSSEQALWEDAGQCRSLFTGNTTIGAVLTNGAFNKAELGKIAAMAHNGYARAIRPVHTTADGDSIYALSVGSQTADLNAVGSLAAYVMGKAISRAVQAAEPMFGLPSASSLD